MNIRSPLNASSLPVRDYILLLLVGFVFAFTPLHIISLLIIIFVVARLPLLRFGLIGRLISGYLIFSAAIGSFAALAWIVHVSLSVPLLLGASAVILMAIVVGLRRTLPKLLPARAEFFSRDDIIASVVALGFIVILIAPMLPKPSVAKLGSTIMAGGDNSSHMTIIKADYLNHGYAVGKNNTVNLTGVLVSYPQGWHVNAALLEWTIEPLIHLQSPARFLAFYYGFCAMWFGLFVFLLVRTALFIYEALDRSKRTIWPPLVIAASTAAVVMMGFVALLGYGFQTQIAGLAFLLLEILLLAYAYESKDAQQRYSRILLAGLALAGSSLAWLFLLPVGGVMFGAAAIHSLKDIKKLPSWPLLLLALLVGIGLAYQPAVQLFVKTPGFKEGVVNQTGLISQMSLYIILGIVALTSIASLYIKVLSARIFYVACLVAFIFSLGLAVYQTKTVHGFRYYYFKSLFTVIVFAMPLLAAGLGGAFRKLIRSKSARYMAAVGTLSVFAALAFMQAWQPAFLVQLNNGSLQGISPTQANAVAAIIEQDPANAVHIISIGSCDRGEDIRTVQFANALSDQVGDRVTAYSSFELSYLNKKYLFQSIHRFVLKQHFPLIVIVNDQALGTQLQQSLGSANRYVRFVNIDPSPQNDLSEQCPNRIRTLTPEDIKAGIQ